ncbi:ATP-binding cassette domain-containing protein [Cellvibrio sp. PSBB006]|jgi:sodium transport system ATP-binding protein|uniref:ABC transporter ATP-binding protein n=1 Tax=Cellvibrio sp. PSBB006 TaxID=1987723 RepID=UPI000B3B29BF|nr:ATP-binding cassette domain-containing protein [Cellvibrio sp. PSBB006]ARU27815.1 ABC transporter ATP-binding protein [Cellvibrio sp. PSBB006]
MIQVEHISKQFGKIEALKDVSFTLNDGEITGLLGVNGAGKTTLMRLIYGLLQPSSGRILVDGVEVAQQPDRARQRLGVLPDDTGLYKRLTARENIRYFGELHHLSPASLTESCEELIELLGMHNIADRRAEGFSLGERMKTALARAIVHQPQHIMLDEPTNGLDVITTRAVRRMLVALRDQGRCVLFSSHLMHEVTGLCDRIIVIAQGRIVADGSVAAVIEQTQTTSLEEAFIYLSELPAQEVTHAE